MSWYPRVSLEPLSVEEARRLDADAVERLHMPSLLLMENAARGVADRAAAMGDRFVVLCGPGNNGGDGLAAARHLGRAARVCCMRALDPDDDGDAAVQRRILHAAGHPVEVGLPDDLPEGDGVVWIDALFGTGLGRPLEDTAAGWVRRFDAARAAKLCVDVPSGLDADTGEVLGVACHADVTVTFQAPKHGLLAAAARDHVGELVVVPLGLPDEA